MNNSDTTAFPFAECKFDDVQAEWNKVYRHDFHDYGYDYSVDYGVDYYDDAAVIKCELNTGIAGNNLYSLTLYICDKDYVETNKNLKVKFETWIGGNCEFNINGKQT